MLTMLENEVDDHSTIVRTNEHEIKKPFKNSKATHIEQFIQGIQTMDEITQRLNEVVGINLEHIDNKQ
jgi:hypothetical protein